MSNDPNPYQAPSASSVEQPVAQPVAQSVHAAPNNDQQHLQLLMVFHYVLAGIMALFACFPMIHLAVGIMFLVAPPQNTTGGPPPELIGIMFIVIAAICILFGWATAIVVFLGGRNLAKRKSYTFCIIAAAVSCLFMPLGTILGVFTIVVLQRPSVKALFAASPPAG